MTPSTYEDDSYDEFDDVADEWADDDDAETETLACPNCKAAVFEETQQCPSCGDWITPVYPKSTWARWAWPLAAVLVILALLMMTVGLF